ncbi:MAG: sigma-54-dependent Fis family transcriptional regulator [Ignavibacteriaceae bacterium]|nr:sigma-54-dependent Fis family transcriptional regulator [Ignavibacteriaceae bacterium]
MNPLIKILVADDDQGLCYLLNEQLTARGYLVDTVYDGREAKSRIAKNNYDAVLLDLKMNIVSGEEVLKYVKEYYPALPVIILSGESEMRRAIDCIKGGAYDYITKPYDPDNLDLIIKRAYEHKDLLIKKEVLEKKVETAKPVRIKGTSKEFQSLLFMAKRAAESFSNILIEGETGTGKELLAEYVHQHSERAGKPFVVINCASLPDQLIESELFGYEKGAFTDAKSTKQGLVEIANGGTLFLDEIGEMSLVMQPKLLRFLENGEYRRVGGVTNLSSDVRVIVATNRNLMEEVEKKTFRSDLLFRLNVITLSIPPLRERKDDILMLAKHFLESKSPVRSPKMLSAEAERELCDYSFPGNIRELEHIIERAIIFSEDNIIKPENLFLPVRKKDTPKPLPGAVPQENALMSMEEVEKHHILSALNLNGWDRNKTSASLGISLKTLYLKIKRYNLKQDGQPD